MKLPLQAPAVARENYSWQARPTPRDGEGLLPAENCTSFPLDNYLCALITCPSGKKVCTDSTHYWCCPMACQCGPTPATCM
jgi:hypothetical protein